MVASEPLGELKSDVAELERILALVTRTNVKQIITKEIQTLKKNIQTLEQKQKKEENNKTVAEEKAQIKSTLYTTKISNYAIDETPKFVKLYVTIKDAEKLTPEQLTCDFTETSFKFIASNHLGKNHMLQVLKLAHNIIPTESSYRVKAGNVIISLKKAEVSKTWGHITEAERKAKEAKEAKYDTKDDMSNDPSSGIMNMMKKMYDEGDDDMKRMIKKTWYETQQKKGGDGMPGMPNMDEMTGMGGMPG